MTQEIKQRIKQLRLNKTPDGYKKTAIGVIPQEWEVVRFKKLFSRLTRRNTELNKNVLTISAQYGLISQEEFFNKTVASENTETYFLLNKGDFAYNKSYSNGYPFGAIKSLTKYDKGIVSPLYICFSVSEENKFPEFYNQYFEAGKFNREINAYAQEGARNHGLLNIAVEDFFNSLLIKPPLAEQQKIAEILSAQDKVIELQQKRIDELKKLKKAYLTKMFPQKGSNVPELRFKGFTDLPAGRQVIGNWCVYVLECKNGSLYKGKTNNLLRRITEHMKGQGAEHTKKYKPIKLVYFEAFKTEQEALQKEDYLKSGSGREWLKNNLQKYLPLDYSRPLSYDYYDWEQRKLGDIADSFSGGTPAVDHSEYYGGEIPFIRSGEVNSNFTELFITSEGLKNSSAKIVDKGDILYALYGATSGETGLAQFSGAINQAILAIKPHFGYDSEFMMQWLRKNKDNIINTYLQGGQGNLSGTIVNSLLLDFPTLAEQQKIGSFFRKLDDAITLQSRKLDAEKLKKKSLMQLLLTGIVRVK